MDYKYNITQYSMHVSPLISGRAQLGDSSRERCSAEMVWVSSVEDELHDGWCVMDWYQVRWDSLVVGWLRIALLRKLRTNMLVSVGGTNSVYHVRAFLYRSFGYAMGVDDSDNGEWQMIHLMMSLTGLYSE